MALLIMFALLSACGAKGDLYLPDDNAKTTQQQDKPEKKKQDASEN